nr:hypothetical protein [Gammaproteobacteria bacterium]
MIMFVALSGTLLLIALILILLPLLRSVSTGGPSGREVNLQLARHRLIELESDVDALMQPTTLTHALNSNDLCCPI